MVFESFFKAWFTFMHILHKALCYVFLHKVLCRKNLMYTFVHIYVTLSHITILYERDKMAVINKRQLLTLLLLIRRRRRTRKIVKSKRMWVKPINADQSLEITKLSYTCPYQLIGGDFSSKLTLVNVRNVSILESLV